jgi:sortase family protein
MNPKDGGLSSSDRQRQTVTELARNKVLAAYSNSGSLSAAQNQNNATINQNIATQNNTTIQSSGRQYLSETQQPQNSSLNRLKQNRSFAALSFLHSNQHRIEHRMLGEQTLRSELIQKYNSENRSSLKQAPINLTKQAPDWQKYHSDWQNYYQKYYSEYYAKAAQKYLETEKSKLSAQTASTNAYLSQDSIARTEASAKQVEVSLRERIREKANSSFKLSKRHKQFVPIFAGVFSVLFVLFLQYNRLIFAPIMAYIAPGNTKDTGITAIDPTVSEAPTADPRLLIPKLNVDVPVFFNISNDTATINNAMNHGVAQFKIPGADAMPGQIGNLVISGHSAGDIYSNNQYKFIFSGLERLVDGDLIYVNYNSVRYTYKVYKRETVEPTNVAALVYKVDKPILTLITCTPLGSDRYRLLVMAEQINPSYEQKETTEIANHETGTEDNGNAENKTPSSSIMPANERSFFDRVWRWLTNQKD